MANTAVPWIYLSVYLNIYIYIYIYIYIIYIYIYIFISVYMYLYNFIYIYIYIYIYFFAWAGEKSERRAPSIEFKGETVCTGLLGSGIRRLLQPS